MKRKRTLRQMLSLFLVWMMVLTTPLSALAAEDVPFLEVSETEMTLAAEESGDAEAAVPEDSGETVLPEESSEPEEIPEEMTDPAEEIGGEEPETVPGEAWEEMTEGTDEILPETETFEEEAVQNFSGTSEDPFADGFGDADTLAASEETTTPAEAVKVYLTVSNKGVIGSANDGSAMVRRAVTVTDVNGDGILTYNEALIAAHAAYNSAEGYVTTGEDTSEDGKYVSVSRLWGVDTINTLYYLNGSALANHVGHTTTSVVKAGDQLLASVNKDDTYYSDRYVSFDAAEKNVTAGEEFTLTLSAGGAPAAGVSVGTWYAGTFTPMEGKTTGEDGSVTLSFAEAGTYLVSANGTVKGTVTTDWSTGATAEVDCPIMAPACTVTVEEGSAGPAVTEITLNKTVLTIAQGCTGVLKASLEPEEAAEEAVIAWSSSDPSVATVENGIVTGVAEGNAVIKAAVGSVQAECAVTVTMRPRLSGLALYKNQASYNAGEAPQEMTPAFDGNTYDGYSVSAPDYVSSLYAVATLSEETVAAGSSVYGNVMFSNGWGGWTGGGASNGVAQRDTSFINGSCTIYFSSARDYIYQVDVHQYATLKGLVIDGVTDAEFNRDLTSYHAYVDSTAEGVSITATPYSSAATITMNNTPVTGGEAYVLPYSWDENGKMQVEITVARDGMTSTTYQVELEKTPLNDAPYILKQPKEADYIAGNATKELTVVASANGEMAYQWYVNTSDSNENGTAIDGAVSASYTPSSETVGTAYYYCVVTNTGKTQNNTTASETARVTVDPDPTPVARIAPVGTAMPEDGYEYAWDTGYLYSVDAEAFPLTVTASSAAEGAVLSYQWLRLTGRPYNVNGYGTIPQVTTNTETFTPPTGLSYATNAGNYYGCRVTATFKGKTYTSWATTGETYTEGEGEAAKTYDVCGVYVFVKTDVAAVPEITKQPVSASYVAGDKVTALSVSAKKADSGKLSYQWYESETDSTEGGTAIEGATKTSYNPGTFSEAVTKYYYCIVTNTLQGHTATAVSQTAQIKVKTLEELIGDKLNGSGTEEAPYLISDGEGYQAVAELVAQGVSFAGMYFRQVEDVTLPDGWKPIGVTKDGTNNIQSGANLNAFSGILDGNGKTVTVPSGGKPLLGYVKNAEVRNLNIYGEKINGYGLVNNFEGVGLSGSAIVIDNVTLKSGSSTLKSGLIGANITTNGFAGCSAGFVATIRNCTIEEGVVIGYNRDQNMIGSIAGRMQGTIENCVSYATVYGTSYVGGIVGTRDNAMGLSSVSGCEFHGTVEASGDHAGGIAGGGYTNSTAPNGGIILVNNCSSDGQITGADKVGGILGGDTYVAQLWGTWTFKNNSFTGKVSATAGTYVGGAIGFLDSLNKYDDISNNYYDPDCGASKGIGFVQYVDTSCETHETESGATYFNTANGTDGCPAVAGCGWKANHNRTDDPLGADAHMLTTTELPAEPYVTDLTVSGEYRTLFYIGEALDLTGLVLTAQYSDGTDKDVDLSDVTITGYDNTVRGDQTLTLEFAGAKTEITVKVLKNTNTIRVSFRLMGDDKHGEDGTVHTLIDENLKEWVPATTYTVDLNATVYDVLEMAAEQYGFVIKARETQYGTYVYAIEYKGVHLEEFDNGPNSGWMDTVNGEYPDVGFAKQYLEDGDVIVVHYTDDYTREHKHTLVESKLVKATLTADGTTAGTYCDVCGEILSGMETIYHPSKITLSKTTYTYNGKVQKPSVKVVDSNGKTIASSNYTVTYSSGCKNAGTYTVKVTFKGNYSGSKSLTYKIQKANQTITASNKTKTLGDPLFALGVKCTAGSSALSYQSGNAAIAAVSAKGNALARGVGQTTITITANATTNYNKATKKITITVRPKGTTISGLANTAARRLSVAWKTNTAVDGYQIQYGTAASFAGAKTYTTFSKTAKLTYISNLTKGKTYYVRIRTFKKVSGKYYYSTWSPAKNLKLTK